MKSEECINIIKDRVVSLIKNRTLKATYRYSDSTFSFYVNDIDIGERPLLTLRLSDHNPTYQNYVNPNLTPPSEGHNVNISIEFYKPKFKSNGRKKRNRVNADVSVPHDVHGVVPFVVNSYEYIPPKLEERDIEKIYDAVLSWIYGGFNAEYVDPFANTSKEAKKQSKIANITWNIAHNISVDKKGNYVSANGDGADYVSESIENKRLNSNRNMNKTLIRITESDLHRIVRESVDRVLRKEYPNQREYTSDAYGNPYAKQEEQSIRNYWGKKGLRGEELDRKVQTVMHNNALRRRRRTDHTINNNGSLSSYRTIPRE